MIITPSHLGWIPPAARTEEMHDAHADALTSLGRFQIKAISRSVTPPIGTKVMLTDTWKHPGVVRQLGFAFPGVHQLTGACVGAGGGNMLFTLNAVENIIKETPEAIMTPFWLLPYGRSRSLAGMRGQGEGSLGSTFAKACQQDGVLDATDPSLPPFQQKNGLIWGESTEMKWSDGNAISSSFLTKSRNHLVTTASPLNGFEQVRDSIVIAKCPVTRAFEYFCNPGSETLAGGGDNQVVLGKYDGRGGHQETWQGYWNHPDLGELIYEVNQWGDCYKLDPSTGLAIGVWHKAANIDKMCQLGDSEIYSYAGLKGYEPRDLIDSWPSIAA